MSTTSSSSRSCPRRGPGRPGRCVNSGRTTSRVRGGCGPRRIPDPEKVQGASGVRRAVAGLKVRLATPKDLDTLVRHRRGMWVDISHFSEEQLEAGDRDYRRWTRPRLRSGTLVGFIVETPGGKPIASGCLWMMPRQPRPMWGGPTVPDPVAVYNEAAHPG